MFALKKSFPNMALLILDTSTSYLCLGLVEKDTVIASTYEPFFRQHAEQLLPQLMQLLKTSNRKIEDIDACLVTLGPGSFTGIRLGLTSIKTFAFSRSIPVYTMSSLALLAHEGEHTLAIMDARANRFYAAQFNDGIETMAPRILSLEALNEKRRNDGSLVVRMFDEKLDIQTCFRFAAKRIQALTPTSNIHALVPFYLKDLQ